MLPLPTMSTPRSRNGASRAPRSKWESKSLSALIESWTTGMSAFGNACTRTDQVPWSMPQLSWSRPTCFGFTISATSSASSGLPGAG